MVPRMIEQSVWSSTLHNVHAQDRARSADNVLGVPPMATKWELLGKTTAVSSACAGRKRLTFPTKRFWLVIAPTPVLVVTK